jgi:hypothetical protein
MLLKWGDQVYPQVSGWLSHERERQRKRWNSVSRQMNQTRTERDSKTLSGSMTPVPVWSEQSSLSHRGLSVQPYIHKDHRIVKAPDVANWMFLMSMGIITPKSPSGTITIFCKYLVYVTLHIGREHLFPYRYSDIMILWWYIHGKDHSWTISNLHNNLQGAETKCQSNSLRGWSAKGQITMNNVVCNIGFNAVNYSSSLINS